MANNTQSKSLAMMFLLGAFLTGGALGFVADRAIAANKPAQSTTAPSTLARTLDLSEAQQLAIDSIMKWRNQRDREEMKPIKHLLVANRDSARVLIRQRLNPTQLAKFEQMLEETRLKNEKRQNQQSSR